MDNPERRKLLPQESIIPLLDIKQNDKILDVGAGAGYFTFPLAEQTSNTVYALDIEKEMLDYIQKLINHQGTKNITLLLEPIEIIPLENASVQCILASMVLHEVQPLDEALKALYRVLEPGVRFVIIDWIPEPKNVRSNRIHSDDMKRISEQAGFKSHSISTPSEEVYALVFTKPID